MTVCLLTMMAVKPVTSRSPERPAGTLAAIKATCAPDYVESLPARGPGCGKVQFCSGQRTSCGDTSRGPQGHLAGNIRRRPISGSPPPIFFFSQSNSCPVNNLGVLRLAASRGTNPSNKLICRQREGIWPVTTCNRSLQLTAMKARN
jgi:hypothetical protein